MTFGTTLLANGVHPIVVKELMRHSDLKLTTNLYNDSSQLPLAQGVGALPSIAGEMERTHMHTTGEKELTSPRSLLGLKNGLFQRTSKRTQIRAQTGVAASHDVSSPVAESPSASILQPSVSVAVGREQARQGAKIRGA